MKLIKWFKKKFKTVYCNECKYRGEESWYRQHDCHASPYVFFETKGSLLKRPETTRYEGYRFCEKVKKFPWCSKYKQLTEEDIQARKEAKEIKRKK